MRREWSVGEWTYWADGLGPRIEALTAVARQASLAAEALESAFGDAAREWRGPTLFEGRALLGVVVDTLDALARHAIAWADVLASWPHATPPQPPTVRASAVPVASPADAAVAVDAMGLRWLAGAADQDLLVGADRAFSLDGVTAGRFRDRPLSATEQDQRAAAGDDPWTIARATIRTQEVLAASEAIATPDDGGLLAAAAESRHRLQVFASDLAEAAEASDHLAVLAGSFATLDAADGRPDGLITVPAGPVVGPTPLAGLDGELLDAVTWLGTSATGTAFGRRSGALVRLLPTELHRARAHVDATLRGQPRTSRADHPGGRVEWFSGAGALAAGIRYGAGRHASSVGGFEEFAVVPALRPTRRFLVLDQGEPVRVGHHTSYLPIPSLDVLHDEEVFVSEITGLAIVDGGDTKYATEIHGTIETTVSTVSMFNNGAGTGHDVDQPPTVLDALGMVAALYAGIRPGELGPFGQRTRSHRVTIEHEDERHVELSSVTAAASAAVYLCDDKGQCERRQGPERSAG